MMQPTLQFAKTSLGLSSGVGLHHAHTKPDKASSAKIANAPPRVIVGHVIALDDFPERILAVGLGRPSAIWSSGKLFAQLRDPGDPTPLAAAATGQPLWPPCRSHGLYGGNNGGGEMLTTDLALWWLCMLAISGPQNCAIMLQNEMVGIGEWEVFDDG
ncbi:hypothetical protein N0V88_002486 [Collariella sp. IMI 366227]|nr:hypothetical protein N0V88_002486 [Collariella sp. IMI 366227]